MNCLDRWPRNEHEALLALLLVMIVLLGIACLAVAVAH